MLHAQLARARRLRDDNGFTLIELLIVILILGVLAAIVVFSVRGITDRGDEAACKSNFATTVTALEAYYANSSTGVYPSDLAALVSGGFLADDPSASGNADVDVKNYALNGATYDLDPGDACD